MITFYDVRNAMLPILDETDEISLDSWQYEVMLTIDRSWWNAHDTIYNENQADENEFGTIALATIESILANETKMPETVEWFAAQGVKW